MMSDRRRGSEDWYGPTTDRSDVGQRKIEELQRQIMSMETDMKDRSALIHKLNRLQVIEDEKREIEDKVIERNSRSNTPRLLKSEMERLYGRESQLDRNNSPGLDKNVIETVMQHRTREFSQKQHEAALKAKYLDKERQRLQEARRRVEEQRRALQNTMSPTGKPLFSFHGDKLYMQYQPYHFFPDRDERIRDSFVLPISTEVPKVGNWKFKVKFVPVPLENDNTYLKYEHQMVKEHEPEVDEAVKAFQSFTANKPHAQRPLYPKVRYVPQCSPEEMFRPVQRDEIRSWKNYQDYYWKRKKFENTQSGYEFHEPLKFAALHRSYRTPEKRLKTEKDHHENMDLIYDQNERHYADMHHRKDIGDLHRKLKVKFRPTESYGEPYRSRKYNCTY